MKFIVCGVVVVVVLLHESFIAVALNDEQLNESRQCSTTTHNTHDIEDGYSDVTRTPEGLQFGGSGYMILAKGNSSWPVWSPIIFSFRTFATSGLMFLIPAAQPDKGYLSIYLMEGNVYVTFGSGRVSGTTYTPNAYNDGKWHRLNFMGNHSSLIIDGKCVAMCRSHERMKTVETDNMIYFGGNKGQHRYPSNITQIPFQGCIKDVQLENKAIDFNENLEIKDAVPGCPEETMDSHSTPSTGGGTISIASSAFVGTAVLSTLILYMFIICS